MATRRMISKTISISKKVNKLDDAAALLYTWIQPHTDDFGCMDGDADSVRAIVVPRRAITEEQVEDALEQMEELELIERYTVDEENYLHVTKFEEHQTFRSDRPRRSEYPTPDMANGIPKTTKGAPKVAKRQRKLSEVKLSEGKVSKETEKESYGELGNVKLTIEEYQKIVGLFGEKNANILIFELDTYVGSKGTRYKSHYATLLNWARRKSMEQKGSGKGKQIISST